ncbi:hypothetical protein EXO80_26450, partial [Salmonella enterica]|nr:hypothetical protein [Salmonella enterica]
MKCTKTGKAYVCTLLLTAAMGTETCTAQTVNIQEGEDATLTQMRDEVEVVSMDTGNQTTITTGETGNYKAYLGDGSNPDRVAPWNVNVNGGTTKSSITVIDKQSPPTPGTSRGTITTTGELNDYLTHYDMDTENRGTIQSYEGGTLYNTGTIQTAKGDIITNEKNGVINEITRAETITNRGYATLAGAVGKVLNVGTMQMKGDIRDVTNEKNGRMEINGDTVIRSLQNAGSFLTDPDATRLKVTGELNNEGDMTGKLGAGELTINNKGQMKIHIQSLDVTSPKLDGVIVTNMDEGQWTVDGDDYADKTVHGLMTFDNKGTIYAERGTGKATLYSDVHNTGNIDLNDGPLIIKGSYTGTSGATITTRGELGDDDSRVNTLTIEKSALGSTAVKVTNLGGAGGKTQDGILVIRSILGGQGEFTQSGRIVAGTYDYTLVKVDTGAGAE